MKGDKYGLSAMMPGETKEFSTPDDTPFEKFRSRIFGALTSKTRSTGARFTVISYERDGRMAMLVRRLS